MRFIFSFLLLLLLFLSACSFSSEVVAVHEDVTTPTFSDATVQTGGCPRGIHSDPYPGICPLYRDINNNGECDLGE